MSAISILSRSQEHPGGKARMSSAIGRHDHVAVQWRHV